MENEIPKVKFNVNDVPHIEVMDFNQLKVKLESAVAHNPYKAHKIEFYLILIVTKGVYTHFVDFRSYQVNVGSAVFVSKNQVHHFNESMHKTKGYAIVLNSAFMDKYHFFSDNIKLNRLFNYHIGTPLIESLDLGEDSLLDIAKLLYKEYVSTITYARIEMLQTLMHVLLLRAERSKEVCSNLKIKPYWLELFNDFRNLLEVEYIESKNARFYAKKMLISYKFLNDIVKELTGLTAKTFIDQYVTTEIKRYLASTSLSIKEIAYKVGFMEPANMVKFFKRNANVTPLKFRERL